MIYQALNKEMINDIYSYHLKEKDNDDKNEK